MTISNFFIPNRQIIEDISRTNPGVVTTSEPHGYSSGLFVRLFMPYNVGMNVLNNQVFEIVVVDTTNFSIGIDTSNFDAYSPANELQSSQVIPVGSDALGILEAVQNNGTIEPEL